MKTTAVLLSTAEYHTQNVIVAYLHQRCVDTSVGLCGNCCMEPDQSFGSNPPHALQYEHHPQILLYMYVFCSASQAIMSHTVCVFCSSAAKLEVCLCYSTWLFFILSAMLFRQHTRKCPSVSWYKATTPIRWLSI